MIGGSGPGWAGSPTRDRRWSPGTTTALKPGRPLRSRQGESADARVLARARADSPDHHLARGVERAAGTHCPALCLTGGTGAGGALPGRIAGPDRAAQRLAVDQAMRRTGLGPTWPYTSPRGGTSWTAHRL